MCLDEFRIIRGVAQSRAKLCIPTVTVAFVRIGVSDSYGRFLGDAKSSGNTLSANHSEFGGSFRL